MIDKKKFKTPRTAEVTLSTGDKIPVRELSLATLKRLCKTVPGTLPNGLPDFSKLNLVEGLDMATAVVVECGASKEFPVVAKPDSECSEEEISVDILAVQDIRAIFEAALALFMSNNPPAKNTSN